MKRRLKIAVSLLEVLFALSILSLALFGTITALATSSQVADATRDTVDVSELLQDRIERLRAVGPVNVAMTLGQPVAVIAGFPVAPGGTEADFTFTTGGLKDARVVTEILDEATASTLLQRDIDGDGNFGENPDDLYDLDGDGIVGEVGAASDNTQYRIVPVRVTITYRAEALAGGIETRRLASYIYPISFGS